MRQTMYRHFLCRYQKAYYVFELKYVYDGHFGYHAHILKSPDYGNRNASLHNTYRVPSENGYTICWSSPVRTIEDMDRISEFWCMATVLYIVHGGYWANYFGKSSDGQYTTKVHRKKLWMWLHYKYRLAMQALKNKKVKGDLSMNNSCAPRPCKDIVSTVLFHSVSPAGYGYIINEDRTATISELPKYPEEQTTISLPKEVDGIMVRDFSLTNWIWGYGNSKHIFVPEGIQSINGGHMVFGALCHVWLPRSLKSIEGYIASGFSKCGHILHVYPDSYAQQYAQEKKYHYVLRDDHDIDRTGISDTGSVSRTMI